MQISSTKQYRGYAVSPSAHSLPDGCFSSNVLLSRPDAHSGSALYEFYSIGYFSCEEDAIVYSDRWARDWIDTRG
ncbi:hypothetical protein [Paraburkholderia kururiensis]|jgi:hypothetical protein|uniref:Transcriptional regulator n=1 Tax=Paraburkholderia kururiensis TaxID=984307 RepID=A0ABZ0WKR4_9BURK|nr:hypothetical protein [Paraburkholderia kururiensis]WQD77952.1 hypothetical protein U0042_28705 [Paraburkholderia kururiensis]